LILDCDTVYFVPFSTR